MSNNVEFNSKEFLNQKHIEAEQHLLENEKFAKNIQNYIDDTEYKLLVTNLYVFKNLYKFFGKRVRDNISINVSF